jgi:hypothetical protein
MKPGAASDKKERRYVVLNRSWMLVLVLAVFPFLMRTGIDIASFKLQGLMNIYRAWRWSPEAPRLPGNTTIIFELEDRKGFYQEQFRAQLQKDFKLVDFGEHPRVRAFFEEGESVHARIELSKVGPQIEWQVWEGETRLSNNGFLFGPWAGSLLFVLGAPLGVSLLTAGLGMLVWYSDWSPLHVPGDFVHFVVNFVSEIWHRSVRADWTASELSSLPALGAFTWVLLALAVSVIFVRRSLGARSLTRFAFASFLFEPLFLYTSSLFGKWGSDTHWWKVYLGSFPYRFLTLALVFFIFFQPKVLAQAREEIRKRRYDVHRWALLLPLIFVACDGWAWLNSVLAASPSDTLLRLKVFMVGFLISYITGSRIFAIWIATLALALIQAPTKGHWDAGTIFGFTMDGLLLGWFLSPFKGFDPVMPLTVHARQIFVVGLMAWLLGVFLSSVGVPLGVCWVALILAVWAYGQITRIPESRVTISSDAAPAQST